MTFFEEMIISGFIGMVICNCADITKAQIREADKNRKSKKQNLQTRIYQIIIDAINETTNNKYKNQDVLYDAAEKLLISLKNTRKKKTEAVRVGLSVLDEHVNDEKYEEFIRLLYCEICKSDDLYKEVSLLKLDYQINDINTIKDSVSEVKQIVTDIKENRTNDKYFRDMNTQKKIVSRTQEYADKWNANMFLNDFDKRDENTRINVTLGEVYLEEHLPQYIWKKNSKPDDDLKELLSECINQVDNKKMLLILGQPGIGKSTLVTWLTTKFKKIIGNIIVYQFASDLKNIKWKNTSGQYDIVDEILKELKLSYEVLEGKILILDGFDEVNVGYDRESILNGLYWHLIKKSELKKFSLIITCRENYIQDLNKIKCDYITLQPWDNKQIRSFCKIYWKKIKCNLSEGIMNSVIENKEILGIPLILYMVLALNISIEQEGTIVDVYDQIFSLYGGIYDRCINNDSYASPHRIKEIKRQIHQISREIAIWMFENNPEKACIPQKEYKKICNCVMQEQVKENKGIEHDFLIGNYFRLLKHCEGIEELYFVHRSIYEYFVAETIFNSIEKAMMELSEQNQEELAGNIAVYLKQGQITKTIGIFLKSKIMKLYYTLDDKKKNRFYQWWEETVGKMMEFGMFYYTGGDIKKYKNIISKELKCFLNLMEILRLLMETEQKKFIMEYISRRQVERYIRYCTTELAMMSDDKQDAIDLRFSFLEKINLCKTDLSDANLVYSNLSSAFLDQINFKNTYLKCSQLKNTKLFEADLRGADLFEANIRRADLRKANLKEADLKGADLSGADLSEAYLVNTKLKNAKLCDSILRGTDLRGADLSGADFRGANLQDVNLAGAQLECSVWREEDIQNVLPQLKKIYFEYVIVEIQNKMEKISKRELFSDVKYY